VLYLGTSDVWRVVQEDGTGDRLIGDRAGAAALSPDDAWIAFDGPLGRLDGLLSLELRRGDGTRAGRFRLSTPGDLGVYVDSKILWAPDSRSFVVDARVNGDEPRRLTCTVADLTCVAGPDRGARVPNRTVAWSGPLGIVVRGAAPDRRSVRCRRGARSVRSGSVTIRPERPGATSLRLNGAPGPGVEDRTIAAEAVADGLLAVDAPGSTARVTGVRCGTPEERSRAVVRSRPRVRVLRPDGVVTLPVPPGIDHTATDAAWSVVPTSGGGAILVRSTRGSQGRASDVVVLRYRPGAALLERVAVPVAGRRVLAERAQVTRSDGDALLVDGPNLGSLWRVPLGTGAPRPVLRFDGSLPGPTWEPGLELF
jgi:hypothetical protein